jgi:hypothetical protein
MLQFSDQVAEKLAQDISEIPAFRDAPTQLVLSLGDLSNKTDTPTTDFEAIQYRIRSKVINSKLLSGRFLVIEDRRRVQRQLEQRVGGSDDGRGPQVQTYDPAVTYLLLGDFFESTATAEASISSASR